MTPRAGKRIVLVPSAYAPAVGGVEELTHHLARGLLARGHDVEVWTNRWPADLPAAEVVDGVRVRRFTLPMPAARGRSLARFAATVLPALWQLARAMRARRPEVLHVQCFSSNGIYAGLLADLFGVPLVVTLQGETVMDDSDIYDRSALLRAGLRRGLRRAAAVTGCSQFVVDDAVSRFGLPPGRGEVVPNAVDLGDDVALTPFVVPFDRFVFAVGRFVEKKGFDLLVRGFAAVAEEHPGVGLVIGGDGQARDDVLALARSLGVEHRVHAPGRLGRSEVAWAMARAEVFVLPSRVEPFGIVVLEAMRGGTPVIVSDRGGASEIVRDGQDGAVVDPEDREALGRALSEALDRPPADAAALRASASGRVERYSWATVVPTYEGIYERVLATHRRPRLRNRG